MVNALFNAASILLVLCGAPAAQGAQSAFTQSRFIGRSSCSFGGTKDGTTDRACSSRSATLAYADFYGVVRPTSGSVGKWYADAGHANATVIGSAANEQFVDLSGGGTLTGLGGDDTYLIQNGSTKIVEAVGGGVDSVYSYVDYGLSANI
jgi:hypothetical protein